MSTVKRKITKELHSVDASRYSTIGELRELINNETLQDDDILDIYGDSYDGEVEVTIDIKRLREETDEEFAKRFNEEEARKVKAQALLKAQRYQQYLEMREEFEAAQVAKVD